MWSYPNDRVLVDVEWLKEHLAEPGLRILDVRANDPRLPVGYRIGHLPGAIELDPTREFFVFANRAPELAPDDKIAAALGQRGVAADSPVVIYDEWTGQLAALTFWVMRYMGHSDVRILHGGWTQWWSQAGAVTREVVHPAPVAYHPHADGGARATAEWIQANVSRNDVLLLDVRSPDEFHMGHIPGAVNVPYDDALEMRSQMYREPADLRSRLQAAGVTPDREIVTYCSTGVRSAHMFATLSLLDYAHVRNYDGSMTDWHAQRGLPVE
jgi:thiosulfate/3-mercaptopyruvate sulfurtransferase